MFRQITASRSGRKGSAKPGHKAAAIRTSEEETKLFYDRLRDAFEARFEQAAIYDRAGNQLRFLNRKTSGRYVFHGGAPRASNYKSDDNPVGFLPPTPFLVSLPPSLAFSNLSIYPSASLALSFFLALPLFFPFSMPWRRREASRGRSRGLLSSYITVWVTPPVFA